MSKIQKVKQHFRDNKKVYITGATCLTVGAAAGFLYPNRQIIISNIKMLNYKPTDNSTTINAQILVEAPGRRMHPGYVIRCNETGEVASSIRRMAEVIGVSNRDLAKHLRGEIPDVNGMTFTNLGEAVAQHA